MVRAGPGLDCGTHSASADLIHAAIVMERRMPSRRSSFDGGVAGFLSIRKRPGTPWRAAWFRLSICASKHKRSIQSAESEGV
jgi:hypothetical protein